MRPSLDLASFRSLVLADLAYARCANAVRKPNAKRKDVFVVEDTVKGRKGISVPRIRPDRMRFDFVLLAVVDCEATIVAIEAGLDSIGRREDG
jgi:hypothetical protein